MQPFVTIRQASATYPVYVGHNLFDDIRSLIPNRGRIFVITSTVLRDRFGEQIAATLDADVIDIEEGEANKTLETANDVVTQLVERGAKRDSMAVVVGGGMVGDTAGFAASIFLRGIDLVHVPTTLLAQVDSSLGGKLAVNHAKGKNLIGSFYPPRAVISDLAVLDSLPRREVLSGLFEALKGGVIGDASLFELLESPPDFDVEQVVRKAIRVKAEIVSADEKEADLRRLLNYGHTIAHGIEAALDYRGLTHGEAVAWGMIAANAIAIRRRVLDPTIADRIEHAIRGWNPSPLPDGIDRDAILAATEHDKKNTGSRRVMVFPRAIGHCEVFNDVTEDEIAYGVDALLSSS
jgi:3-dehydroquinate synthase